MYLPKGSPMKIFSFIIFSLISWSALSKDLTIDYINHRSSMAGFDSKELAYLQNKEIILVPGILSEVFTWQDDRGIFDFSFLTTDYFGSQLKLFKKKYHLSARKIFSSSFSVADTSGLIAKNIIDIKSQNKKAILMAHSLGGLALLDYLLNASEEDLSTIEGILFLQVPFYGSPMATVFLDNPYHADKWLRPILPFFHTSMETIYYLSLETRQIFMNDHLEKIQNLLKKIPTITMSGITNNHRTLFKPAVDVMKSGCIQNSKGKCLTPILYKGPYDLSDGMVSLEASMLSFVDSVVLDGVDHGEPILRLPLQDLDRDVMTESLIKLLIKKAE